MSLNQAGVAIQMSTINKKAAETPGLGDVSAALMCEEKKGEA